MRAAKGRTPAKVAQKSMKRAAKAVKAVGASKKTSVSRSNKGGAVKGQARASQVHSLNASRKSSRKIPVAARKSSSYGRR